MKILITIKRTAIALSGVAVLGATSSAGALTKVSTNTGTSTADQTRIAAIITKGDQEITRRIGSLGKLTTTITNAQKLSSADKATLSAQVSNEVSGLTALKTKLDAETTLDGAKADAQSIYTDYRVYALILPKVYLVKTADDQLVTESKLSDLATKLQARITAAKTSGKDVTSLQADLVDMMAKTQAAQAISNATEAKVIGLQPSDYDTSHTVLSGDRDQLKIAHTDNQTAAADAKSIVAGLGAS